MGQRHFVVDCYLSPLGRGRDPEDERNAVATIRTKADVAFEGFVEQGVRAEAEVAINGESIVQLNDRAIESTVVIRFSGEQTDFFTGVSEVAILMATERESAATETAPLIFEPPFRWGVSTLSRRGTETLSRVTLDSALMLGERARFPRRCASVLHADPHTLNPVQTTGFFSTFNESLWRRWPSLNSKRFSGNNVYERVTDPVGI